MTNIAVLAHWLRAVFHDCEVMGSVLALDNIAALTRISAADFSNFKNSNFSNTMAKMVEPYGPKTP